MRIEDLTIGELRKLVEPLSAMHQREATAVIASHGNVLSKLTTAIGSADAKFVYHRLKKLLGQEPPVIPPYGMAHAWYSPSKAEFGTVFYRNEKGEEVEVTAIISNSNEPPYKGDFEYRGLIFRDQCVRRGVPHKERWLNSK